MTIMMENARNVVVMFFKEAYVYRIDWPVIHRFDVRISTSCESLGCKTRNRYPLP
jgi:hypothetical protein